MGECFTRKYDQRILKIKFVLLVFTDSKMCESPPLGTQKYDIYDVYMVYRAANYTEAINLFANEKYNNSTSYVFSTRTCEQVPFVEHNLQCTTLMSYNTLKNFIADLVGNCRFPRMV